MPQAKKKTKTAATADKWILEKDKTKLDSNLWLDYEYSQILTLASFSVKL